MYIDEIQNLLQTIGPILTKLGTMHPWLKGIQVCSNDGPFNCHIEKNGFLAGFFNKKFLLIDGRWSVWRLVGGVRNSVQVLVKVLFLTINQMFLIGID